MDVSWLTITGLAIQIWAFGAPRSAMARASHRWPIVLRFWDFHAEIATV
jgi:hypothetical protein